MSSSLGNVVNKLFRFYFPGVVLFPEATLPLRVIHPHFVAAVERALKQVEVPYTIGVVGEIIMRLLDYHPVLYFYFATSLTWNVA